MHSPYPIVGQFQTYITLKVVEATDLLVEFLGVNSGDAKAEMQKCRGTHVRHSWLKEIYEECCVRCMWEFAARVYLLHLVGSTIFAEKSATLYICFIPHFVQGPSYVWRLLLASYLPCIHV